MQPIPDTPPLADAARRQWLLHTGAASLLGLAGCATPPVFEPPPVQVGITPLVPGQHLRFRTTNLYNGADVGTAHYRVTEAGADGARRMAVELPGSNIAPGDGPPRTGWCLWTDRHHVREDLFFDVPCRFEQPDRLLPQQLGLGSSPVLANIHVRADSPARLRWTTQVTGEGWERIDVPAGRFLALRVHRVVWFDHPETWRRGNMRSERLWFAPSVGFWVRREWSGEYLVPDVRRDVRQEDRVRFELL